ncbi:reticulocyte-binding protein 2 homolog a-like isoform X2 [Myzus persicae]|uniref:reticulocyte-binding protein 2 homolog a-like isoform X2 n=1 Tax=Myzus persicae TaxID=13164 RepID=UPI000B93945A|nr:reticulocyte-binding protein 2 homolog a-like isoform X2 [Myzus persicae]
MASSNTDSPGTIYRWIERKPLTEAVIWTSREKFWLMTSACHYGTHDWKSVAQVVRNAGEPYRPREWYTPKSCECQFKIIISNSSKEVKSLPLNDMLEHIADGLKIDYMRDANKSKDALKSKYCNLFSVLNRVKQGNLSRNEVVSLYSQARRNEIEGKQYMDQLMTRQNASLASENSSSGLIEEPIKWNTPSAPLLTSLLRSRNTIPVNRTATNIASLLQSPGGTSRTRSGKLLPLTPSIRTTQGTPTLSKLLEAPANPYIPSPPQSTQKNKLSEVGTERLAANTSRKENSQSTSLNRGRVDNMTTLGSFNQVNKSDLSATKKQTSKSPVSVVKNVSKANSNVVNLLSDSDTDEETKNTSLKSSLGDKKDISSRLEPRATRSQTRAEGSFKQFNTKLSDGKKERENLRQQSGGSQINETQIIDDDLIDDLDQIEVEPLSSVQDEIQSQTPSKMTRSSLQRLRLLSPGDNLLTNTKVNNKEISNKMLEEISANFVLNSTSKSIAPGYKCLLGLPDDPRSESLIPVDRSACKEAIMIRKESQLAQNTLATYNGKLLKQKGIIEIKAGNIKCVDSRNDSKLLSYNNQPIVVVNKIKKPFNIQFASEQRNKTDDIEVSNTDVKKPIRLNNSSQNVVELIDSNCSLAADDVIVIDDDININEDNRTTMKTKELISKGESKTLPSTISSNLKSTVHQLDDKKNKNDKSPWNMFGKTQTISDTTKKHSHQDSASKSGTNSNINESNNRFIKELDFDFDQSISELYNGVDAIVEMHSFDNEELNSLIECGSLDSNDTEERIDSVGADQGDSSVSESDSTIGAFDTFAQITRVRQKSFTPKNNKLDIKDLKTTNQEVKHLKENFCQSEEIYDDQTSTASSVSGIPILKGVLSDVMSQIGLDSVASHEVLPSTDVVEISSDEEVMVDVPKAHPLDVKQIQTREKEVKSYKSLKNDDELIKIHEIEAKMYKGINMKQGSNTIKPSNLEMPQCIVVKNLTSDAIRTPCNKILEFKEDIAQKYDNQAIEMTFVSNTVNIRKDNESYEAEVNQPQEITVKIANEKLIKETEKMKKEGKESEERKKKDEERKKKEEDNERKKKEDSERKKKEEDERKKKEDDRMKKELEKKRQYELFVRKKNEEERINKEDYERKKKEEEERKIKDLQEKMKLEEQKKLEREKEAEERENEIIREKLKDFRNAMRADLFKMPMNAVVKEEPIDEPMDYFPPGFYAHSSGRLIKEELIDEQMFDEQIVHEQLIHEQVVHEQIIDEEIMNEEIVNEEIINDEIINEEIISERIVNEEVIDEDCFIDDELKTQSCDDDDLSLKTDLMSHIEPTDSRDLELQSIAEALKLRNKITKYKNSEDLKCNREIKITARDVQVQRGYIGCQRKTIEQQSYVAEVSKKQRAVETETQQKSKEENELISGALKEYKIRRAKEYELLSIELAENIETKKSKEAELRIVEETALKGIDKRSLKKLKEPENNQSVGHTNVNLSKNYVVPPVHFKKKNDYVETDTNIEQGLIESKKAATNIETFNVKERGIKKLVGSEGKSTKGIETISTEAKMITRTRGLKGEEKLKESNVSKNMSTKLRSQIKFPGSSMSSASPTSEENPPIPSYEYKKLTKNTDDTSKRNSISNTLYDNKNNRDLNIDSNVIVRKENLNREVIGIPRTRTRSSSFKQVTISETRSSKKDQNNGAAVIPKETVGTKTLVSTSTHPDHRTTRSKSPPKTILNKHTFDDGGKTLVIPVVMLTTSEIPLHKIQQRSVTSFIKQQEIKPTHDQSQKQVVTAKQLVKSPPKKRGRKPRINIQNKKLQESYSSKNIIIKTTSQSEAKMSTLIKEIEPLAKRTRRSLGLRGFKNNSTNKQLDHSQPHSTAVQPYSTEVQLYSTAVQPYSTTVQPFEYKGKFGKMDFIKKRQCVTIMKFIYDKICEDLKTITILNEEVMSVSSQVHVLRCPVDLHDINRFIISGQLIRLGDLMVNLMVLSYNAAMMNKSTSIISRRAYRFQLDLKKKYQKLLKAVGEHDSDFQNVPVLCTSLGIKDYSSFNVKYTEDDLEEIHQFFTLNKKSFNDMEYDYFDSSSCESADSDCDTEPPKKKRKINMSDSFSSESE